MLILFDIDATLLRTGGAGMRAMRAAGAHAFHPNFAIEGVPFTGRLDPVILLDLLRANGVEPTAENLRRIRSAYHAALPAELATMKTSGALPGVMALLSALAQRSTHVIGLLTGNFPETGKLKLSACGIAVEQFRVQVWGDDSPHVPPERHHLPPVARTRFTELLGRPLEFQRITIIGDSPADVDCAKRNGCRCLGVGTGQSTADELRAHGADHAVPDLSDTERLLAWLTAG